MPLAKTYEIEIVQVSVFEEQARRLFTDDVLHGLMIHLALHPEAGDVIKGTNGVRKLNWSLEEAGKSSGARVVYYFRDLNMPLYLLAAYAKNQEDELVAKVRKQLCAMVDDLVHRHGELTGNNIVRFKIGESA